MFHIDTSILYWFLCLLKVLQALYRWFTHFFRGKKDGLDDMVELVKIRWRANYYLGSYDLFNYLFTHKDWIAIENEVLNEFELHGVNGDRCWMSKTSETDIYNIEKFPFVWVVLNTQSTDLAVMSLSVLDAYAGSIKSYVDDRSKRIVVIANTARCGSTLLCQMFNKLPHTLVISEPWWMVQLNQLRSRMDRPEFLRLLRNLLRVQLRLRKGVRVDNVVIKTPMFGMPLHEDMYEEFRDKIKFVFLTRHPKDTMKSLAKITAWNKDRNPITRIIYGKLIWSLHMPVPNRQDYLKLYQKHFAYHYNSFKFCELQAAAYAFSLATYLCSSYVFDACFTYNDIVKNPERISKELLEHLDMFSESNLKKFLTGMDKHSQLNKNVDFVVPNGSGELSKIEWKKVNQMFRLLKVPVTVEMSEERFREKTVRIIEKCRCPCCCWSFS